MCNAEKLSNFITNDLNPAIQDRHPHLLLDNVRFHHSHIVRQVVNPNITLMHIPPYSPQLNPIEEVFSLVKHNFKRQKIGRTEDVMQGVTRAVQAVQLRPSLDDFYQNYHRWLGMAYRGEEFPT